jgi:hypothetical protein
VCTNASLKRELSHLKRELSSVTDIRDKYSALAAEVANLRQLIDSLKKEKTSPKTNTMPPKPKRTYARVARTAAVSNTASTAAAPFEIPPKAPRPRRDSSLKVKVDGARRIWGTVPTCTAAAVAATISKLISHNLQLRVRRKTKPISGNKVLWWFVVHGAESDLVTLEQNWDQVQTQTLWLLQNCYMSPQTTQPEDHPTPVATIELSQHTAPGPVVASDQSKCLQHSSLISKDVPGNVENLANAATTINNVTLMTPTNRSNSSTSSPNFLVQSSPQLQKSPPLNQPPHLTQP